MNATSVDIVEQYIADKRYDVMARVIEVLLHQVGAKGMNPSKCRVSTIDDIEDRIGFLVEEAYD